MDKSLFYVSSLQLNWKIVVLAATVSKSSLWLMILGSNPYCPLRSGNVGGMLAWAEAVVWKCHVMVKVWSRWQLQEMLWFGPWGNCVVLDKLAQSCPSHPGSSYEISEQQVPQTVLVLPVLATT